MDTIPEVSESNKSID